jgi:nucleoid-associated protein YgaU
MASSNDRYNFTDNIKRDANGKTVYKSILYPKIRTSADDIFIMVKETDRLDLLADKYYGDVTMWWIIAQANHIKNTFYVTPGTQIRIPTNTDIIISDTNDLNRNS